ncbi:hydrogenase maturation protease [Pseudonocardia sp. DLS-67]
MTGPGTGRVLVAGVGNVLLSDDGFGVEVVRALRGRDLPPAVELVDAGIRGMHLAYQLLDGYAALVLVDTVQRDSPPGTVHTLEHDLGNGDDHRPAAAWDAHGMDPASVLAQLDGLAAATGAVRPVTRVLVIGCEPARLTDGIGLSPPVAAAVGPAVDAVLGLVAHLARTEGATR